MRPRVCDCGSGRERVECCHKQYSDYRPGVLWQTLHICECDDEYQPLANPKVVLPNNAGCAASAMAVLAVLPCAVVQSAGVQL